MELPDEITAARAGEGNPAALLGEFRRAAVLVPLFEGGLMSGDFGGIRWVYAFTDETALARFDAGLGPAAPAKREHITVLGGRLLDTVIPSLGSPAGVAVDVADEDRSMLFPPVVGIVPDRAAVDADTGPGGGDETTGEAAR
ncbi:MAG: hypothetical protein ACRDP3_15095 [Streptomyces sp.]|uniref:hypothetical protein n=1 Tax=Streptomyces sp. TaxID=1931 RepID=UPI003D6A9627